MFFAVARFAGGSFAAVEGCVEAASCASVRSPRFEFVCVVNLLGCFSPPSTESDGATGLVHCSAGCSDPRRSPSVSSARLRKYVYVCKPASVNVLLSTHSTG